MTSIYARIIRLPRLVMCQAATLEGSIGVNIAADNIPLPATVLSEWLRGRVTWFIRTMATTLPAITDGAHLAFLLQVGVVVVVG